MTAGLNPTRTQETFTRNPVQATIEEVIEYSTESVINLYQEATQSLPIKFNITGGEVNQFIEALK